MKYLGLTLLVALMVIGSSFTAHKESFEQVQKSFQRVADAYNRKEELIMMKCRTKDVSESFNNMFIRVFKQENIMEIWVQDVSGKYIKFNECKIYAMSGTLGPKRVKGDCQVPEGYYHINEFNPASTYHLSLGINYPNESDMKLSQAANKGGDIFIHGAQASAGCMAMSNYYIEDIYIYAVKARNQGQAKIPVQIYPFKMTVANMNYYSLVPQLKQHVPFWNNLVEGYRFFEKHKRPADVSVDNAGKYHFTDPRSAAASQQ